MSKKLILIIIVSLISSIILSLAIDSQNKDRFEKKFSFRVMDVNSDYNLTIINNTFGLRPFDSVKLFTETLNAEILFNKNPCSDISELSNILPVLISYDTDRAIRITAISENEQELDNCKKFIVNQVENFNLKKRTYYLELANRIPKKNNKRLTNRDQLLEEIKDIHLIFREIESDIQKTSNGLEPLLERWDSIESQMGTDGVDDDAQLRNDLRSRYVYDHLNSYRNSNNQVVQEIITRLVANIVTNYYIKDTLQEKNDIRISTLSNLNILYLDYEFDAIMKKADIKILFICIFLLITTFILLFYFMNVSKKLQTYIKKINNLIS